MAEAVGLIKGAAGLIKDISLIYGVVESARDKIISCLQNGLGSLLGDGDDLEKIKSSLNTICSVIGSAEEHPLKDQALVDWLQKLKDAAYNADDVLDEYATQDLRRKVEVQNSNSIRDRDPVTNKVHRITSLIYPVLNRTKMNLKLKEIRKRLESIEEESQKFQLSKRVIKWDREFKEQRQTHSSVDESEVYGRDEEKEKIVNLVLHPVAGHEDEKVSVIPIVGMGGLGKTTLAQLVFNNDRVHNHFHLKMWVCVSDDFDVKRLIKTIIGRVPGSNLPASDQLDLEALQLRVREALNGRIFLLVLDDVWNEDPNKWKELRDLLKCGGRGSRIVVTTRSPKIAFIMSKIEPHHLEGLSEGNCWKLFASRAFPDDREGDHPKLVEIGKDILKKCRGVPLAVITMGSLFSFSREESEWVFVRDSELWNLAAEDVRGILPALRLSYYHLNPHLRQCFAFCAIFPKDYEIDAELLMQLWMAHGCVPSIRGKELEDIGIQILNELLMRSLFQEVEYYHDDDDDYGSSKIKVHDLVHDLAQSVMENDCCIMEPGKSGNFTKKVRHLSYFTEKVPEFSYETHESLRTFLVPNRFYFDYVPQDMAIFKFLRVLHLESVSDGQLLPTSLGELIHLRYLGLPSNQMETLPESISNLQNLRTLNLSDSSELRELPEGISNLQNLRSWNLSGSSRLRELPEGISNLQNLRSWNLSGSCRLRELPEGISNLQNLLTLNLSGLYSLRELPKGTGNLINLRCLDLEFCPKLSRMPAKVGMLSCLRKMPLFVVGGGTGVCSGIEELRCLNQLKGNLMIVHLERVAIPSNAQRADLIRKPNLDFLQLGWGDDSGDDDIKIEAEEEVLKGLQPHKNLKGLEIFGYRGSHFPGWMTGSLLPSIVKMTLEYCRNCEILPPLGQLPSLKFLCIRCMDRVENIGSGFYGNVMSEGFPSLEVLEIEILRSLKVWSGLPSERVLASLKYLTISYCTNLKSLPEGIENLSSLEMFSLENVGLTSLPENMKELSTLRSLSIMRCPRLPSLPEWVGNLTALQYLTIDRCPQMVSLPVGLQRLTGLQSLKIIECHEMQRRCQEAGEDFHKIRHIPKVEF